MHPAQSLRRGVRREGKADKSSVRCKNAAVQYPGGHKTVNPPYGSDHTEALFMSNLQTCWRQTVCQNRLPPASPQGIAA